MAGVLAGTTAASDATGRRAARMAAPSVIVWPRRLLIGRRHPAHQRAGTGLERCHVGEQPLHGDRRQHRGVAQAVEERGQEAGIGLPAPPVER